LFKNVVIFTVIEIVTLIVWRALVGAGASAYVAAGILLGGLIAEHIVSSRARRGDVRVLPVLTIAGVEAATWIVWLALTATSPAAAVALLISGLHIGHVLETNYLSRRGLFAKFGDGLQDPITGLVSVIETIAGVLWVAFPSGPAILSGGLLIEHTIATFGRRKNA